MAGLVDSAKSVLGYGTGEEDRKAEGALKDASDAFKNIPLPELQRLLLQNPTWLEDLQASTIDAGGDVIYKDSDAALAKLSTVDGTEMDNVSTDPRLKEQQMASLSALKELADGGGMTAADKANLSRVQNQAAQADKGRRDAIMMGMGRRGMGGSGMELLAQLDSSQAATDRQSEEGLNIAGMAQDRALQALMQGGSLAGNIRGQDFGEQSRVAEARDAIAKFNAQNANSNSQFNAGQTQQNNQFNTGNSLQTDMYNRDTGIGVQQFNAGQVQDSNKFNITGRQGTHNTGVDNNNTATKYNAGIPQQQFDNQITKAGGQAGVAGSLSDHYTAKGDRKTDEFGNIITGGATMIASDERKKKNVKSTDDVDLDTFLATIQPKKFKYKNPADGEGDRTGVMAQDLLKSKLGQEAVVQTDDGMLGYDKDKMQGIMLAALKHLSDKIDKKKG
jgi:hypothetical protein